MKLDRLGEFHIHVNAHSISSCAESFLVQECGFRPYDPCGYPDTALCYKIPRHFVKDAANGKDFKSIFRSIETYFKEHSKAIDGFIEGEYVSFDTQIEEKEFNPNVSFPFKLFLKNLPPGTFRQNEIHIIFDKDKSDIRLIDTLRKAGLFSSAYLKKTHCTVEVLSAQGNHKTIGQILPQVLNFMESAGGGIKCNVMEEKIVQWWVSSPSLNLPPIIDLVAAKSS